MSAKIGRWVGATFVIGAYILTLVTQIPHIYDVYSSLEVTEHSVNVLGLTLNTAWGAAIAFELSVAIFTWRLIVNKSNARSKWTKRGVVGFLALSFMANLAYYFNWTVGPVSLDADVMPFLLAAALPLALWLYAEEFGHQAAVAVKKSEREERAKSKEVVSAPYDMKEFACWCGEWGPDPKRHKTVGQARGALGAHTKVHRAQARDIGVPGETREYFESRYKNATDIPDVWEIGEWV
jgi:hypothetical protein